MSDLEEIRHRALRREPLGRAETARIVDLYFRRTPLRTLFALERFPLERSRVLDVGCAYGTSLLHFGQGSVGIDNSREAVRFLRALDVEVRLADVETEEALSDLEGFDFVWVSDILEHLEAPRLLLRRLSGALTSDGRLLLQSSVLPSSVTARALLRARGRQPFDADVHYHQWTRHTLAHLLRRSGYRVEKTLVLRPPSWHWIEPLLRPRFAPRLLFVAAPDPALLETVARSERRNRQSDP